MTWSTGDSLRWIENEVKLNGAKIGWLEETLDRWIHENRWMLEWKILVVILLQFLILWRVW